MTLGFRTRTRAMNRLLVGSCLFSTAAFVLTYILAEDTEQYFAWTVQPPLSAAFFGAGYGAGALLAGLSLRERSWARIRPGVLAIIIFATLTLVVTLLHRDRFHFGAGGFAEGSAWLWLAIYIVFPIAGVIALVTEWRALGSDPRRARFPRRCGGFSPSKPSSWGCSAWGFSSSPSRWPPSGRGR